MKDKFKNLPLRSGVGIVLLNKNNKVFVAKRIDNSKNFWQMPQGGVDDGEDFLTAAYRELEEETSVKNVKLIKELDGLIKYDWCDTASCKADFLTKCHTQAEFIRLRKAVMGW